MIIFTTTRDANPDRIDIVASCDGCTRRQPLNPIRPTDIRLVALLAQTRDQLHARGWIRRIRHGEGLDLCPTCARIEPRAD